MLTKLVKMFYQSEFSKRIGLYKNPRLKVIKNIYNKIYIRINRRGDFVYVKDIIQSKKELSADYLAKNTYQLLYELSIIDPTSWGYFMEAIADYNFKRIEKKEKINVMFLCNFSDTWSCGDLYRLFLNSHKFHPYIVAQHFYNGTEITIEENFTQTYNFFVNKGYEVYKDYDYEKQCFYSLQDLGSPDIIFHLSPYNRQFPAQFNVLNFPLTTININIPYGIYVAELSDAQYCMESFSAYWRIFDLPFYTKLASKYTPLGSTNRVGSGYCKLDAFYQDTHMSDENIWKFVNSKAVKIIYAPHHSIGNMGQKFSTFDSNFDIIYQIAKNMYKETSWIFKPHPLLKKATVQSGLFKNEQEYDEYIAKWDALPNARVVIGGDYFNIFKTSDAMILDSDSFLAEYLYVKKPLLLLSRSTQKFSDLGEPLSKVIYRVSGEDKDGILWFINEVVIEGNDMMKQKRNAFFSEYLDYYSCNGILASEYIYSYLKNKVNVIDE